MTTTPMSKKPFQIGAERVALGETRDVQLEVSQTYTGVPVSLPLKVVRGPKPGPAVFLTGAVHGDEINGSGVIRELMLEGLALRRGTLVCLPVVNIFGFENHSRYLPDRRDLNRSFPGDPQGSLALRLAHVVFSEVIQRCDYGIDLHTAAVRRTNFPHVRADLDREPVRRIAEAFGCELIFGGQGPERSLRRVAAESGCATIVIEAGEAFKFEPGPIRLGVRGVKNVLRTLDMLDGEVIRPAYQTEIRKSSWVRASAGGLLRFHVAPGQLVEAGDLLATCDSLFRIDSTPIAAPKDGIVLGMTTLPAVKPGEPVCHLAVPREPIAAIREKLAASPRTLHRRLERDLATNVAVAPLPEVDPPPTGSGGG